MRSALVNLIGSLITAGVLLTGCALEEGASDDEYDELDELDELDSTTASLQRPCGTMLPGESLSQGQALVSCGGRYTLGLQGDGNLVLRENGVARWNTGTYATNATPPCSGFACTVRVGQVLAMQGDGNLVLYGSSWFEFFPDIHTNHGAVWNTRTFSNGARLELQTDGNLVVYNTAGQALWNRLASKGTLIP